MLLLIIIIHVITKKNVCNQIKPNSCINAKPHHTHQHFVLFQMRKSGKNNNNNNDNETKWMKSYSIYNEIFFHYAWMWVRTQINLAHLSIARSYQKTLWKPHLWGKCEAINHVTTQLYTTLLLYMYIGEYSRSPEKNTKRNNRKII